MPAACWTDSNLEHVVRKSTSTTASFAFPTGYSTGNLIVVACSISCFDSLPTSPATPSGWTKLHEYAGGPHNTFRYDRYVYFAKVIDGTEGGSISLTSGGTTFRGWGVALIWIDAKLDGDEQGGWFDDSAVASNSTSVAALTADRTDNIYLYAAGAPDNTGLSEPSGFCRLVLDTDSTGDVEVVLGAKRISSTGSTGAFSGGGSGPTAAIGMLIPANPYADPVTLRPTVGYIGLG